MNTPSRWSCRVARASLSIFGDSNHRRGLGSSHVAHCAECLRYFAAVENLSGRLRTQAADLAQPAPAGLDARVLRAIANSKPAPRPARRTPTLLALAGAAAAVAGLAVVWESNVARLPSSSTVATARPGEATRPAVDVIAAAGDELAADEDAASNVAAVLERNPLQSEAESVYADARGAVRFLALNFLPADTAGRSGREPRRRDG